MKNSFSYLALGVGLLSGTLFAYGQTPSPMCLSHKRRKPCPAAASPRRRAAIGRSGEPADDRAPYRRHRAGQDGAKGVRVACHRAALSYATLGMERRSAERSLASASPSSGPAGKAGIFSY